MFELIYTPTRGRDGYTTTSFIVVSIHKTEDEAVKAMDEFLEQKPWAIKDLYIQKVNYGN